MTSEDIIKLAREAGFIEHEGTLYTNHKYGDCFVELERFAALIAAATRKTCANEVAALIEWQPCDCGCPTGRSPKVAKDVALLRASALLLSNIFAPAPEPQQEATNNEHAVPH